MLFVAINADKPNQWPADIQASVDLFNEWFTRYAPDTYRRVREKATTDVLKALDLTNNLRTVSADVLQAYPGILPALRMATAPPLAVDRLVGLSGTSKTLIANLEQGTIPVRMRKPVLMDGLAAIATILTRMIDADLFPWLASKNEPTEIDRVRAASVVADRLTLAVANPVIRNAQEERQLQVASEWLKSLGYVERRHPPDRLLTAMEPGTFAFRMNVIAGIVGSEVNIPIDLVLQPHIPRTSGLPILIEAKSAGDFTNVNKRRKEEADKVRHLRDRYGDGIEYILLLGGYFDRGYLEYEARAGIDWVWEHRISDLSALKLGKEAI